MQKKSGNMTQRKAGTLWGSRLHISIVNSFSRSAWDSALRLSTYGAQEKRPCGSSDQLSAQLCCFAQYRIICSLINNYQL